MGTEMRQTQGTVSLSSCIWFKNLYQRRSVQFDPCSPVTFFNSLRNCYLLFGIVNVPHINYGNAAFQFPGQSFANTL